MSANKPFMTDRLRFLLYILLCGLMGMGLNKAWSYEYNGEHWQKDYVYSWGTGCDFLHEFYVEQALEKYSPVEYKEQAAPSRGFQKDSINSIHCSPTPPYSELHEASDLMSDEAYLTDTAGAVVGKARWWWDGDTLAIAECDIWFSSEMSILSYGPVAIHEIGHCWGMQHSKITTAIMAPELSAWDVTLDDLSGLSSLYGSCATVQVDAEGISYFPAIDPKTILRALNSSEYDKYRGQLLSGYLKPGEAFPYALYDIKPSLCN